MERYTIKIKKKSSHSSTEDGALNILLSQVEISDKDMAALVSDLRNKGAGEARRGFTKCLVIDNHFNQIQLI